MVRTSVCVKRRLCPVSQKVNFELGKEKEIYERVRMDADKSQTSREAREWTQFMSGEMQRETRVTLLLLLLLLKTTTTTTTTTTIITSVVKTVRLDRFVHFNAS